jgi:mRNA interferase RelE/StbE
MSRTYALEIIRRAERALEDIPERLENHLREAVLRLAENPRPAGCQKIQGRRNMYRIRVGDYRVIYAIEDERRLVLVLEIGHRREIYRRHRGGA